MGLPTNLDHLRQSLARLDRSVAPAVAERFSTGLLAMDGSLGGGLARGALHEVFAAAMMDEPSAAAFTIALALRASEDKPIVWIRQDCVGLEMGEIYPPGLAELGLAPERLILVRARDGPSVLRAGEEAARCAPLGAVLIEPWGNPKTLDLVATRRLSLAAGRSGLPVFMIRAGGIPNPSAAVTRWSIASAPSRALEANAPGSPCFVAELLKDRSGPGRRTWTVEWNRDDLAFTLADERTAVSRHLATATAGRPDHTDSGRRRA
jgi:protein ImuA